VEYALFWESVRKQHSSQVQHAIASNVVDSSTIFISSLSAVCSQYEYKLYIWSTKDADEVDARWEQNRVIKLNTLLPDDADFTLLDVVAPRMVSVPFS